MDDVLRPDGVTVRYFSYRYPESDYDPVDTYNALPINGPSALHRTVLDILTECDGAQIELIGHSMGGVVGLLYLFAYGRGTEEGRHIVSFTIKNYIF